MKLHTIKFIGFVTLLGCCGCAMMGIVPIRKENKPGGIECAIMKVYDGPVLPVEQLATLTFQTFAAANGAVADKIDGRQPKFPPFPVSMDGWEEITFELMPGRHEVLARYAKYPARSANSYLLRFTAEAGHRYLLNCETKELPLEQLTAAEMLIGPAGTGGPTAWKPFIEDLTRNARVQCEVISVLKNP